MPRTTIRSDDITDAQVKTVDMAVDPTNASNLSSGSVPTAQLGNVDTSGITSNADDIALLAFRVAANGSFARYNLVDQSVDAFEDASGVDASASTAEVRNASKYYSGKTVVPTGGTITTYSSGGNDYVVHSFTSSGTFTVSSTGNTDILLVAGGGAGGYYGGGGGGAGGLLTYATQSITSAAHTVTVGTGGVGNATTFGGNGTNSVFGSLTAAVGGGGGGYRAEPSSVVGMEGKDGGSGGGTGKDAGAVTALGGTATAGQGYDGGTTASSSSAGASGGGGASVAGEAGQGGEVNGDGGNGLANAYRTGSNVTYAGGGGGGSNTSNSADIGHGGTGGGGEGAINSVVGSAGTDGLGGGGGGGGYVSNQQGYDGGDGLVVIRFVDDQFLAGTNNMTLVSNAQTAQSAPTNGDLVITYTDGSGTAVANTNIKAYLSRDGSAYTSAVTLVSQGTTGGHTILTANGVDLSGITSGTSMRWKIETLVQSASMETRIQAVSLGWS